MRLWRQIRLFMTFPSGVYFKELLVCKLCIILLSLYELMVEINIIHLAIFQLPDANIQLSSKVLRVSAVLKS